MIVHSALNGSLTPVQMDSPLPREIVAGAWLQVALALSIEIFLRDPCDPSAAQPARAVSTDRSGGHEASLADVPILRIDGGMTIIRSTKAGVTHGGSGVLDSPLMTQLAKPSGAEDGGELSDRVSCKKIRYSAHSEPAATRRRAWRCRSRGSPRRRAGESHGALAVLAGV
jgi:hypothetical protein